MLLPLLLSAPTAGIECDSGLTCSVKSARRTDRDKRRRRVCCQNGPRHAARGVHHRGQLLPPRECEPLRGAGAAAARQRVLEPAARPPRVDRAAQNANGGSVLPRARKAPSGVLPRARAMPHAPVCHTGGLTRCHVVCGWVGAHVWLWLTVAVRAHPPTALPRTEPRLRPMLYVNSAPSSRSCGSAGAGGGPAGGVTRRVGCVGQRRQQGF